MNRKIIIILLLALLLMGAIGMSAVAKSIYMPVILNIDRITPTLAPTACYGWYTVGYCLPTPTPYVVCLPRPWLCP
jgi:hypothetical protein